MSVATLLDRLEGTKPSGIGRWLARCPAHEDRSPSLSIRELDDGRVLVHCFGGCGALDVLQALDLEWGALFPPRQERHQYFRPSHSRIPARDLLELLSEETSVVAIIAVQLLEGHTIQEPDWQRLATAAARIHRARDHAHGR